MRLICALIGRNVTDNPISIEDISDTAIARLGVPININILIGLRSDVADYGTTQTISFRIIDADGTLVVGPSPKQSWRIQSPPPMPDWQYLIPFEFANIQLPRHGRYQIEVILNDRVRELIPLNFLSPA